MRKNILIIILMASCFQIKAQEQSLNVTKIWDEAPHNAFTDLIRFNEMFYCTFRESTGHAPGITGDNGKIRVLRSKDGVKWTSIALIEKRGYDLRDSKLSITPKGVLMLLMGGSDYEGDKLLGRLTHVSFSNQSGNSFSDPVPIRIEKSVRSNWDWLWRVTWSGKIGYGVVYQKESKEKGSKTLLMKTTNGIDYSLVSPLNVSGMPGESTIRLLNSKEMLILVRRDGKDEYGFLGNSTYPFKVWDWKDTHLKLGGPNMIITKKGDLLVGTRMFLENNQPRTGLFVMKKDGSSKLITQLPSGGDNSYPGMLIYKDSLYISYYSSHEGKSDIYVAKIPLLFIKSKIERKAVVEEWCKYGNDDFKLIVHVGDMSYQEAQELATHAR